MSPDGGGQAPGGAEAAAPDPGTRRQPEAPGLTHVDPAGALRMVDVGDKAVTDRRASASGTIRMRPETLALIRANGLRKGDVVTVARIAGIMASKRAAELIPLCHPLPLDDVQVEIEPDESLPGLRVVVHVRTHGRTGAEMEALTAVSLALLTIYDMAKGADREMVIGEIVLEAKTGGVRGSFSRVDGTSPAPYAGGGQ